MSDYLKDERDGFWLPLGLLGISTLCINGGETCVTCRLEGW